MSERETRADAEHWQAALRLYEALLDLPAEARAEALSRADAAPEARERAARMLAQDGRPGLLDRPLPRQLLPGAVAAEQGDALIGRRLGRWLLLDRLGQGGMATVYRARSLQPPLDQIAALKLLSLAAATPAGRVRFEREIDILVRLRHPGIAPVFDAGIAADGTPWFAMALVEGVSIDAWCQEQGLDVDRRVALLLQVCDAVEHAHRHLVIHRDIKPGNVLVDRDGRAVLLDFGISRLLDDAATRSGEGYAFTPRFAAPEQLSGGDISTASDVFSLACLLHALLLGAPPQWPDGDGECRDPAALARRDSDHALRRALRGDLGHVLRRALARDPARRYPTVAAFAADLRAWREGHPVAARRGGAGYRLRRFVARHRAASASLALLLLSLAAGMAGIAWQAERARSEAAKARAAQAEAQAARDQAQRQLARAEALNDFLLGLFDASSPERPRDALPTTAELLDSGARRARDPDSGPPGLRARMLTAIARVHGLRAQYDRADPLLAEAVTLARSDPGDEGEALVEALLLQARLASARGDQATVARNLAEAERSAPRREPPSPVLLDVRTERAMLLQQHRPLEAARLLERVLADAQRMPALPPARVDRLRGDLALAYLSARQHARVLPLYEELLAARAANRERDLLRYAIALANSAQNLVSLGHFAEAERRFGDALRAYDRLFDSPNSYRAAAQVAQSALWTRQGRYDEALAAADAGIAEWARSQGRPLQGFAYAHYFRLEPLAAAGRWQALEREARAARAGLAAEDGNHDRLIRTEMLLAQALCRRGDAAAGREVLASARTRLRGTPQHDPTLRAGVDEAEAYCQAAAGRLDAAIAALDAAGREDGAYPPGDAADLVRRDRQRARWLRQQGDAAAADRFDARADARLRALALPAGRPWPATAATD